MGSTPVPTVLPPILQAIEVWVQKKKLEGGLIRLE